MKPFRYFFASCLLWVSSLADAEIYSGPASVAARSRSDWSRFLDQATFGPRSVEIDSWAMRDLASWIAGQGLQRPTLFIPLPVYPANVAQGCPGSGTDYSNCVRDNYSMYPLQVQFFKNALGAEDQLRQRVAYALSQILVVSGVKIRQPSSMVPYLNLLVQGALGNFRDLLESITLNPAMGQYLDMVNSDPASSNGVVKPNENYAREVLQLFSIGINRLNSDGTLAKDAAGLPIPNYSQETIEAFARAFTGWTYATLTGATPIRHNPQNFQSPMEIYRVNGKDQNHDHNAKHLLDYSGAVSGDLPANQDAQLDMKGALDNIFNHPNVGPFIGKQLIQHLVTSNPSPAYVQRVTSVFNDNGQGVRGDLFATVTQILLDPEARGQPSTDFGKYREPVLFVTAFLRALYATSDGVLNSITLAMGQDVFRAASVFSEYPHEYTVPGTTLQGPEFGLASSSALIARANFINTFTYSKINSAITTTPTSNIGTLISFDALDLIGSHSDPNELIDYLNTYFLHDAMSPNMRAIIAGSSALACTKRQDGTCSNGRSRAQAALYLVATSAQYNIQR